MVAAELTDDGYLALPGLLAPAEVASLGATVDQLLAGPIPDGCARPHNTLIPLRWDHPVVTGVLADPDRWRRLRHALGAEDLRWISGYASVKDPHSPPLWWHQDWWCWDHPISFQPEAAQVAVACYLTGTGPANGALRVLPGSHLRRHPVHAALPEAHGDPAHLDPAHPAFRDQPDQVTLGVAAGDAVAMDYRLLHGTHANTTDARRVCVLLNVAPAWASLPAELRGHLIQHPCQPGPDETPPATARPWLPQFDGPRRDLPLNRHPPAAGVPVAAG